MSSVVTVTVDELRARRERLLTRLGCSWEQLQERAANYTLTDDERDVYEALRSIEFLLADDE